MAKTIYLAATSVDGFIADQDNSLTWLFEVDGGDVQGFLEEFIRGIGAMCMGSATYEWILDHEDVVNQPDKWPYKQPTWVFSSRELPLVPGADIRFASGDVAKVFNDIVEAAGEKDVWVVGGGELAGQFYDQGLLDQIRIQIAAVFLGQGAPLLPRRVLADRLELMQVRRQAQFAFLDYEVK